MIQNNRDFGPLRRGQISLAIRDLGHGRALTVEPQTIEVPGDPNPAAFFIVAATVVPGSELIIEKVGLNPTRCGLIHLHSRGKPQKVLHSS